ncbi:MAG: MBL fold metallo-hydrolase [Bacteroidales bacterium]|jgi:glyoxylase-like metal-dependent hydrolase (beta-lactamase superfamily II)|nr:MBL fold metallo-hydrolase [Bacteroidales bacterium]
MLSVKTFIFNPIQVNTYIVYNENKECVIIDAGNYVKFEDEQLLSYIDRSGLKPIMLLNTHSHIDHVMGNKLLADRYKVELGAHPIEKSYYDKVWAYATAFGINFTQDNCQLPSIDLNEGDTVSIGQDKLKVLFTPGHAPGHICFYDEADGMVFSGDTLFRRGVGRWDLLGGNYSQLEQSLLNVLYKLPDDTLVYCGHGPTTRIGDEKRNNPEINSL